MFNTQEITRFKEIPTPFYYYNLDLLKRTLNAVKEASSPYNYHVHYAFKANTNHEILELINQHGLGADCVSGNEEFKNEFWFRKLKMLGTLQVDFLIKIR